MNVPNTFVAGTPIKSADMNANFASLLPSAGGRTVTTLGNYLANNAVFNVKDFGAVGDGVADDTAAIQAAITAAAASALLGGKVYFPTGTYKTTTTITLPQLVSLIGDHADVTKLAPMGCHGITVSVSSAVGPCRIQGLGIYGTSTLTSNYGVYVPGTATATDRVFALTVAECHIDGFNTGVYFRTTEECTIERNTIGNCWNAIQIIGQCVRTHITNNYCYLGTATGTGNSTGLTVKQATDYAGPTTLRPQSVEAVGGQFYGYAIGVAHINCLFATYTAMDLDGLTLYGIQQQQNSGVVNFIGNWVGMVGTAAVNGFNQVALGAAGDGKTNVIGNSFTSSSSGASIGFNGAALQSNLTLSQNDFSGFVNEDIIAPAGGAHVRISDNRCQSAITTSIFINGPGIDFICERNDVAGAISSTVPLTSTAYVGTAAPTTSTWAVGDFVRNTGATGPIGWRCTVAGSPGTWVTVDSLITSVGVLASPHMTSPVVDSGSLTAPQIKALVGTGVAGTLLQAGVNGVTNAFLVTNDASNNVTTQFYTKGNVAAFQMSPNGHLLAAADNTYDIGASGATRPRNAYIAGTANIGGAFGCNGATAQTAAAGMAALATYGAGTNGFDTAAHAQEIHDKLNTILAALRANGIGTT